MTTFSIYQAKIHLSKLVDAALQGEDVIIAKAGKPLVKITAMLPSRHLRKPGTLKGKIKMTKDFDAPLPRDILGDFEG